MIVRRRGERCRSGRSNTGPHPRCIILTWIVVRRGEILNAVSREKAILTWCRPLPAAPLAGIGPATRPRAGAAKATNVAKGMRRCLHRSCIVIRRDQDTRYRVMVMAGKSGGGREADAQREAGRRWLHWIPQSADAGDAGGASTRPKVAVGSAHYAALRLGFDDDRSAARLVEATDELPVGLQLRVRLRALISTGRLVAGEPLPSVRRMTEWAGVNQNTVRGVYAHLEEEGLIVSRQGRGTFVADDVEASPELERLAAEGLQGAVAAGLSPRDLADVMLACVGIPGGLAVPEEEPAPSSVGNEAEVLEVRKELRRQIGHLEGELAGYARDLPRDLPTAPRVTTAHVSGVEELEQTRDILVAQLFEARLAAERRVRAEARKRARQEGSAGTLEESGGPLSRARAWWLEKH
jgi:GntR family transcriptional regulator